MFEESPKGFNIETKAVNKAQPFLMTFNKKNENQPNSQNSEEEDISDNIVLTPQMQLLSYKCDTFDEQKNSQQSNFRVSRQMVIGVSDTELQNIMSESKTDKCPFSINEGASEAYSNN